MPKKLQKTLSSYLSKMKNPPPQIELSKNWILPGCKHPKTPSFASEGRNRSSHPGSNHRDDAATLADVDRFLFENFKSLYFEDDDDHETENTTKRVSEDQSHDEEAPKLASFLFESPSPRTRLFVEPPPDLCGSTRFFVKPGMSGSLVEDYSLTTSDEAGSSKSTSTTTLNASPSKEAMDHHTHTHAQTLPDNCVALLTHSPSPYEDFRRSMQDVVEARYGNIHNNNNIDWDFMEELLFCYLNLNDKKSHKFILSAFVDLITLMRRNSETAPAKPRSVRTVRIGREVRKKTKEVTVEFGSS